MAVYSLISSLALAQIPIFTHFHVLILLLTCLQEAQISALPTGNATELLSTQNFTKALTTNIWKNTTTIQYPPTTTVQNTIPATKGVSGCPG